MSDRTTPELSIVTAWLEAVNARDAARLLAVSSAGVAIIGPRGRSVGHEALSQWLSAAGLTLTSLRTFQKDDTVVVEQQAVWRSEATSHTDTATTLATRFQVRDGRVTEIERYTNLEAALTAAGIPTLEATGQ